MYLRSRILGFQRVGTSRFPPSIPHRARAVSRGRIRAHQPNPLPHKHFERAEIQPLLSRAADQPMAGDGREGLPSEGESPKGGVCVVRWLATVSPRCSCVFFSPRPPWPQRKSMSRAGRLLRTGGRRRFHLTNEADAMPSLRGAHVSPKPYPRLPARRNEPVSAVDPPPSEGGVAGAYQGAPT